MLSLFSAILVANYLRKIERSSPMPLLEQKTKGVKLPCFTSRTR